MISVKTLPSFPTHHLVAVACGIEATHLGLLLILTHIGLARVWPHEQGQLLLAIYALADLAANQSFDIIVISYC